MPTEMTEHEMDLELAALENHSEMVGEARLGIADPALMHVKECMEKSGLSKPRLYALLKFEHSWAKRVEFEALMATRAEKKEHRPMGMVFDEPWHASLTCTSRGMPESTKANAQAVLNSDDDWATEHGRVVSLNGFTGDVMMMSKPPDVPGSSPTTGKFPRRVEDEDVSNTACWLQSSKYRIKLSDPEVEKAMRNAAAKTSFHPVLDYLEWCATRWIAKNNEIDTWLTEYLGVVPTKYSERAGRYWLLSAVARILHPGCQADHVLVMEGDQGIGKSTACNVLAVKPDWYLGEIRDMGNKETAMQLRGKMICEFSELGAMRKSDTEKTKEFLTTGMDKYVPKYSNIEKVHPRTCVFCATVNPKTSSGGYLSDPTGNRRFWPVRCCGIDGVKRIDTASLRTFVNQLWGNAFMTHMWQKECDDKSCRDGGIADRCEQHRWWPDEQEQRELFTPEQNKRVGIDIWYAPVLKFLVEQAVVGKKSTMDEIFMGSMRMSVSEVGVPDQNRMLAILTRICDEHHEAVDRTVGQVQKWSLNKKIYTGAPDVPGA